MSDNAFYFAPEGSEVLFLDEALQKNNFVCYITARADKFAQLAQSCRFWHPDLQILEFPAWDCTPYDRISPHLKITQNRLHTQAQLQNLAPQQKYVLLVQTQTLLQRVLHPTILTKHTLTIAGDTQLAPEQLKRFLVDAGYSYSETANFPGEFAVRGGIIDIVTDIGYRLDFFGNQVESIRTFDPETQISTGRVQSLKLLPSNEVILTQQAIDLFKNNYRTNFGMDTKDILYESISNGRQYAGAVHWLPMFYPELSDIVAYLPQDSIIYTDHYFSDTLEEFYKEIIDYHSSRTTLGKQEYKALAPEQLYLTLPQLYTKLKHFTQYQLSPHNAPNMLKHIDMTRNISVDAQLHGQPVAKLLQDYAAEFAIAKKKVVITYSGSTNKAHLVALLEDNELPYIELHTIEDLIKMPMGILGLMAWELPHGLLTGKYAFLSENDILGEHAKTRSRSKANKRKVFSYDLFSLQPGELVVHKEHGIGQFIGLEALTVAGVVHDFIKLLYQDDDKFYLPVENFELISKYGGDLDGIKLDKLGSTAWQARKARLKNRIKMAAEALLAMAARRSLIQAPIFGQNAIYQEFCHRFPYSETEDQLTAIADISADLSSGKAMDRLVCGDVGFGKTEVALRAACQVACADEPRQVAVIVPSTLLARQHMQTFTERFAGMPVKVKQISRFVSAQEQKQIKEGLKDGTVDIVIGTHGLLAKDIEFRKLGLIIIDEEQHFGVVQKEKLKKLKDGCHILTLSATPIPRTLQMSLAGIKELSLITTPPLDRLPVKTNVMPYDVLIIREAIMREYARGGRVFYVTPRIEYMDALLIQLKELVPEIRVRTISGRTLPAELDKAMYDFYLGKFDLLLSTNIVESGLDIPSANTIIIDRAHLFGLAQLYQMRGRVGRSKLRAYAYLTIPQGLRLTGDAQKRLDVMGTLDKLGGGFTIAGHDMDIRGYGNLVGEEQSGHIKEVGVELYQQMLADAVDQLQKNDAESIVSDDWSPVLNLGMPMQIPDSYIADMNLRLTLYRQIASLNNAEEIAQQRAVMVDRFGALPINVEYLLRAIEIKCLAKHLQIAKIDRGQKGVLLTFRPQASLGTEALLQFVQARRDLIKLRPDNKILLLYNWPTVEQLLTGLNKVLRSL